MLGASKKLYGSLEFVIDFFRSTPASAMFPLFLVLFGVGEKTKVSVAAFGAAADILFNVAYGVMNAARRAARRQGDGRGRLRSSGRDPARILPQSSSACATASRSR